MSSAKESSTITKKISELAKVIRSKNASPFLSTIDFFFDDQEYRLVRDSGALERQRVAVLLRIPVSSILGIHFHDVARGVKISVIKAGGVASGDPDCTDVFGAQQYIPLLSLEIPVREGVP